MESALVNGPRQLPYVVPKGYFASLAGALIAGVHFSESADPQLSHLSRATQFEIPQDYFSNLVGDLKTVAMTQSSLQSGMQSPYAAPAGYVESLPATLLTAAKQQAEATSKNIPTIPLRPTWKSRVTRIAAVALLVLGIGFGSYQYLQPTAPDTVAIKQLSNLDQEAIDSYIDQHVDEFDTETLEAAVVSATPAIPATISTLNESEIEAYLSEAGESATNTQNTTL
jgi:hypothetical protein